MRVHATDDAAAALAATEPFLLSRPADTNVIHTIINARVERAADGHYWWVTAPSGEVVLVAMQTPFTFNASISPGPAEAVDALVDEIVATGVDLPGVVGDAGTAARFAGRWAERRRVPVEPHEGQRLYVLPALVPAPPVPGALRLAVEADEPLGVAWMRGFCADTGLPSDESWAPGRIADRRLWFWDDGDGMPVSMAAATVPAGGYTRVGGVYTPPEYRSRGYAAACVGALSAHLIDVESAACMLFTQTANPTSNAIYQRLGYEAVGEILNYRFGGSDRQM